MMNETWMNSFLGEKRDKGRGTIPLPLFFPGLKLFLVVANRALGDAGVIALPMECREVESLMPTVCTAGLERSAGVGGDVFSRHTRRRAALPAMRQQAEHQV